MHINASSTPLTSENTNCLILFVNPDNRLAEIVKDLSDNATAAIQQVLNNNMLGKKAASTLFLPVVDKQCSVLLIRSEPQPSLSECRQLASALATSLNKLRLDNVSCDLGQLQGDAEQTQLYASEFAMQAQEKAYRFDRFKEKPDPVCKTETLTLSSSLEADAVIQGVKDGLAIADGIDLCRDLGNLPGNYCTPTDLANVAEDMAEERDNLSVKILDEAQMKDLGMGSLLSVSAGSDQPAKLIHLSYRGTNIDKAAIALVGKGVTFDTGGISLKPGGQMDEMKYDMCGAATVLGVIQAAADMALPVNIDVVVGAVENMPSGGATKPGDIVTSMSGKTIEVLNTDAEGRLVLCDALTYIQQENPSHIIDVATLTGACIVALGRHASGLYANNDLLAQHLLQAGEVTGDRAWRMPLWEEYTKQLKSPFADLANIGGRDAGSVTAACFLKQFVNDVPWAHLDIAGTAWKSGGNKGATGRPVKLLIEFLKTQSL